VTQYAHLVGWGKALPKTVLTNEDMAKIVDTSDEWIREHTGIRQRHIAGPDETASTLSIEAGQQALERAGVSAADVDLIILATSSPDYQLPGASFMVQAGLGAARAAAFDLKAGCSGFVYGLSVGSQFIASGAYRRVLVIGAEVVSVCLNWSDRRTCVLFGDGAGAALLEARDEPGGILAFSLGADGTQVEALRVQAAGSKYPLCSESLRNGMKFLELNGSQLLRFALRDTVQGLLGVVESAGLTMADIDLFVPGQSNQRLLEAICKTVGLPFEKAFINIDKYANTSAASVAIALCEAFEQGRAKPGDDIALLAYGAGLTWAAAVLHVGVLDQSPIAVSWPLATRLQNRMDRAMVTLRTASAAVTSRAGRLRRSLGTRDRDQ